MQDRLNVLVGDISKQDTDAIVNAANSTLLGGGGVDGAIHYAGGPQILAECEELRRTRFPKGLPTGEAVITSGGKLKARYVIHTVGPIWGRHNKNEAKLLANCYENSLKLAIQYKLKTIAFPSISTGAYSYPQEEAAQVVSTTLRNFLISNFELEKILLVFYTKADATIFLRNQKFETITN